jgi:hypothetical protein
MGLLLHHNCPRGYGLAVTDVSHLELYEIAGSEFAVDGEIEQGEFPATAGDPFLPVAGGGYWELFPQVWR